MNIYTKNWEICFIFVITYYVETLIMARPIAETPVLTGDDAIRFENLRLEVENLSKKQRADNSRKLKEAVNKAKEYISIAL